MKKVITILAVLATVSLCLVGAASAASPYTDPNYSIESLTISPAVLQPGEQGTVTVVLKNEGTTTLHLSKALIRDSTGGTYAAETTLTSFGAVAAGSKTTLKFPLTAKMNEGTFYPELYIEFSSDSGQSSYFTYMKYPFELVIDSNVFYSTINQRPAVFEPGVPAVLGVSISNLRNEAIKGIQVSVSGEGVTSNEGTVYVGDLDTDKNKTATAALTVTTSEATKDIKLNITYKTGNNWHTKTIDVPLKGSSLKKDADFVLTNVNSVNVGNYTCVTGDVSNAGLATAKAMTVTTRGVQTVQPYPSYVIGALDEDSLSSFEVTFVPNPGDTAVILVFNYKDTNGNTHSYEEVVPIVGSSGAVSASSSNPVVATVIIIILVIIIAGLVVVVWRRSKITKKE